MTFLKLIVFGVKIGDIECAKSNFYRILAPSPFGEEGRKIFEMF